jgi:hypothetical protein
MFGNLYNEDIELKNTPKCKCGGGFKFSKLFEARTRVFRCFFARCKKCGFESYDNKLKNLLDKLK